MYILSYPENINDYLVNYFYLGEAIESNFPNYIFVSEWCRGEGRGATGPEAADLRLLEGREVARLVDGFSSTFESLVCFPGLLIPSFDKLWILLHSVSQTQIYFLVQ